MKERAVAIVEGSWERRNKTTSCCTPWRGETRPPPAAHLGEEKQDHLLRRTLERRAKTISCEVPGCMQPTAGDADRLMPLPAGSASTSLSEPSIEKAAGPGPAFCRRGRVTMSDSDIFPRSAGGDVSRCVTRISSRGLQEGTGRVRVRGGAGWCWRGIAGRASVCE